MEFKEYRLSELLLIKTQGVNTTTDKIKYQKSGIKILQAKDIRKFSFKFDEKNFISIETFKRMSENHKLKKGDVLFTNIGSQLGNSAIYDSDEDAIITWNVMRLVPNSLVNNYFLCNLLNYKSDEIKSLNSSSTMPFVGGTVLLNKTFELPNMNYQKKVVKILLAIDKKMEINNRINESLQKISQELYKRWFVDFEFPNENGDPYKISGGKMVESELGEIPEGWEIKNIKDIAKCVLGGTPSRGNPDFWNGNIAWINSGKINEFRILEPTEYITELGLKKSSTVLLPKKTTVIAITGATLGQVSLLEIDSCANQSVIGIIGNDSKFSEYIYLLINYSIMNIISMQTGGAQQHINKNDVESFKVLVPNKVIIEKFHEIVKPLFEKISLNCFENKNLKNLNTTLLPELLNGTVNVENIEL